MYIQKVSLFLFFFIRYTNCNSSKKYKPTWESLDSRPLPSWFDNGKIGIFLHWGVFSVPSFSPSTAWFWQYWESGEKNQVDFMNTNYRPNWTYADFARDFTAEFYNATEWVEIFKETGAKYIVFVAKHHDGFCNWPTKYSFNWNSMDVGPRRDLVGELANAVRKHSDLHFGVYHSMYEWFNPLYIKDKQNGFHSQNFVNSKTLPELYELVETYKPDIVWSDGEWDANSDYWKSKQFITWLYNESPVKDTVVVNDRWGNETRCKNGGFWDCTDAYNPGHLMKKKWENNFPLDKRSWGFTRNMNLDDVHTMESLLELLARTISCGGNFLINVGPSTSGKIIPIFQERLKQFGNWVKINKEAIYETFPWRKQNDSINTNLWYVSRELNGKINVYAFVLRWPSNGKLILGDIPFTKRIRIQMLGYTGQKKFNMYSGPSGISIISMPDLNPLEIPCKWAWVLKFENID